MKHRRTLIAGSLATAVVAGVWLLLPSRSDIEGVFIEGSEELAASHRTESHTSPDSPETLLNNAAEASTLAAETPTSAGGIWRGEDYAQVLAGTEIDGELRVDPEGRLVVDMGVKDFFDYFLSAVGEVTPERAMEEIRRQAALRLPPEALEEAMALLADYVSYQQLMVTYMQQPLIPADQQDFAYYARTLRESFDQIRELRRQVFSPEAVSAFFALDEAYAEYAVASLEVNADTTLSETERQARQEALKALLPEQMRTAERAAVARTTAVQKARMQFESGAEESARQALSEVFPEEQIDEILLQFAEQQVWELRVEEYLADRAALLRSDLSETDKVREVEALRQSRFPAEELARITTEEVIWEQRQQARSANEAIQSSS